MPKTKITALTKEQKDAIPGWVDKWIKIGLSTEPADRERQEKAIRACYKFAGLKDDVPIVFVSSPIVGALAAPLAALVIEKLKKRRKGAADRSAVGSAVLSEISLEVGSALDSAVNSMPRSAVLSAVSSAVDSAVLSAVDSAVRLPVGEAVGSAVVSAVNSEVDSAVESAVGVTIDSEIVSAVLSAVYSKIGLAVESAAESAVRSLVGSAIKENKKLFWHYWLGGAFWAYWPAFTQFYFEKCGLDLGEMNERANAYAELTRSGGYVWPNKDFIIACDRPERILRDVQRRLHCEDGMAIRWRDGWGLWMWHGIRVPAKLIMDPEHITKEEILSETNAEVQRAYAERLGWKKYFSLINVKKIDSWLDSKTGLHYELYDFENRTGDRQPRLLKMESPKLNDGTMPCYVEPVDPGLKTAKAARKWQLPTETGIFPDVAECNRNPEMEFEWEA